MCTVTQVALWELWQKAPQWVLRSELCARRRGCHPQWQSGKHVQLQRTHMCVWSHMSLRLHSHSRNTLLSGTRARLGIITRWCHLQTCVCPRTCFRLVTVVLKVALKVHCGRLNGNFDPAMPVVVQYCYWWTPRMGVRN